MSKQDMAKLLGLRLRKGVYQLRVCVPKDLQASYGKQKIIRSLVTHTLRDAALKGAQLMARYLQEFEFKRRSLNSQTVEAISPEIASQLASEIRRIVLGIDDLARDSPKLATSLLRAARGKNSLHVGGPASDPYSDSNLRLNTSHLQGMSDELATAWASENKSSKGYADTLVAKHDRAFILKLAQGVGEAFSVIFTEETPGAREALKLCTQAYREAWVDVVKRDNGETVPTPDRVVPTHTTPPSKPEIYLSDVYERWVVSKPRSKDTLRACLRALLKLESFLGRIPIKELSRAQGDSFRAWLQARDQSSKTSRDQFTWIKALLKYAYMDLELIPKNPWAGLDIPYRTTNIRPPWSPEDLQTLFSQPLFTNYELPKSTKAGKDAAYWIPLIGLYTGARISEIAQLRVSDIYKQGAMSVIKISDEGLDQKVKTNASVRAIPIHEELLRLGFLSYVGDMEAAKSVSLWPELRLRKDKPGGYISQWFSEFRKASGITKKYPDFHSFRHSVRTIMSRAGVDPKVQDRITGHETQGSTGTRVYQSVGDAEVQNAIAAITYPEVRLSSVYIVKKTSR